MAVAAMVGKDVVGRLEGPGNGNAYEFLAHRGMHGAEQFSLCEELQETVLGLANQKRGSHLVRVGSRRRAVVR
jgi:hypothetical protein